MACVLCFGEFQVPNDKKKEKKRAPSKRPEEPPKPVKTAEQKNEKALVVDNEWACLWCSYPSNEAIVKQCSMCNERKDNPPPVQNTEEESLLSQISAPGHVKEVAETEDPSFDFGSPWTIQDQVIMNSGKESIATPRFYQEDSIVRNWDEDAMSKIREVSHRMEQQDRLKRAARRANARRRPPGDYSAYLDYAYTHAINAAFDAADFGMRQGARAALEVKRAQAIAIFFRDQAARERAAAVRIQQWVVRIGGHVDWFDGNLKNLTIYEHAEGQYYFDRETKKGRWHRAEEAHKERRRRRNQRTQPVTMAMAVMRVMQDVQS
jgi:hypothetical protein